MANVERHVAISRPATAVEAVTIETLAFEQSEKHLHNEEFHMNMTRVGFLSAIFVCYLMLSGMVVVGKVLRGVSSRLDDYSSNIIYEYVIKQGTRLDRKSSILFDVYTLTSSFIDKLNSPLGGELLTILGFGTSLYCMLLFHEYTVVTITAALAIGLGYGISLMVNYNPGHGSPDLTN